MSRAPSRVRLARWLIVGMVGMLIGVGMLVVALTSGNDAPTPVRAAARAAGGESLAAAYRGRLQIGAAVEPSQLDGPDAAVLASQFGSLVAENVMKPSRIQPREGEFEFAPADALVKFAADHHMAVRGHTLLWYRRTPDWFWLSPAGEPATRDLVLARLKHHIEAVVGRYRAAVYAWDVVNEVIDPTRTNCLRNDQWFRIVGADYIDWAFRYAHAADPKARLFINEAATYRPGQRDCLERIVKGLLARGVPVQGVGHQMHVSLLEPAVADVDRVLTTFAQLGLENQITEFDVSLYERHAVRLPDTEERLLAAQAARYAALMTAFLAHPEVTAVTWWGIADDHTYRNSGWSWWRSDQPLLFDRGQQPKPAYYAVRDAAHSGRSGPHGEPGIL